jgi:hypothetical protein
MYDFPVSSTVDKESKFHSEYANSSSGNRGRNGKSTSNTKYSRPYNSYMGDGFTDTGVGMTKSIHPYSMDLAQIKVSIVI